MSSLLAVVPVRAGVLPAGGAEATAEAGGRVLLVGDGTEVAADALDAVATEVTLVEVGPFAPGRWAMALAPHVAGERLLVLPASPDGRDLAPRLAAVLERPLFAAAMELHEDRVVTIRHGGRVLVEHQVGGAAVVTLQPNVRGVDLHSDGPPSPHHLDVELDAAIAEAALDEVLPPDVSTMDLSEAPRILGGGAGLGSVEQFDRLAWVAGELDASMGATRVITDRGWVGHARQIGTTGVVVDPDLYLAFGISGAVQHTAGLGAPDHIVSVNTDPHCPMMELADLAVVADADATLEALAELLGAREQARSDGTGVRGA